VKGPKKRFKKGESGTPILGKKMVRVVKEGGFAMTTGCVTTSGSGRRNELDTENRRFCKEKPHAKKFEEG